MADPFITAGGWVVSIILGVIALVGVLWPRRGSLEHTRITQLQTDRDADHKRIESLQDRLDELDDRLEERDGRILRLLERDLLWKQWHHRVLIGLADGSIPPMIDLPSKLLEDP